MNYMIIVALLGKSGSGKTTLERTMEKLGYNRIISYTTRNKRDTEINGLDYHFVTEEQFKGLIEKNVLAEYAKYGGNYYGSPRPVGSLRNVIVIEPEGFKAIKKLYGKQVVGVYLDTPKELCEERVKQRLVDISIEDIDCIKARQDEDDKLFSSIEDEVDLVVDSTKNTNSIVAEIIRYVMENKFELLNK